MLNQISIGDWYPERNIFQLLIALTAGALSPPPLHVHCCQVLITRLGPRICAVFLQYYCHYSSASNLSTVVFVSGIARTLACGGWVYVTSTDDHDVHDIAMILYMICNIPWMLGTIACSTNPSATRKRSVLLKN